MGRHFHFNGASETKHAWLLLLPNARHTPKQNWNPTSCRKDSTEKGGLERLLKASLMSTCPASFISLMAWSTVA